MESPLVLVTNDDGIDSPFLDALLRGLLRGGFRVVVAAPLREQSWIGRAVSRRRAIAYEAQHGRWEGVSAWALDGTPTDCVNIALGRLVEERPVAVASGINIGYNLGMPLVLSSGTLAGAIEGSMWGLPSAAFSQQLVPETYRQMESGGELSGDLRSTLKTAGARAADILREIVDGDEPRMDRITPTHNINFPKDLAADTEIRRVKPALRQSGCLFAEDGDGVFGFRYSDGQGVPAEEDGDVETVRAGYISHSVLDFSRAGM